ncbi:hypothetical protein H9Q13_00845 [Pontibacter sp. JH31]|uniref:PH domain-containing protein n=1 Tax=Pontibacter aquaedesilientis TaxID=2766980 RepID=A0ABR7XBL9_9BACT|nr:hypothetical protein [Pontibacter aquaedesilientis]MBD1395699.1 hypothetical protein [Pontibacter aquaedesilientis]
MKEVLQINKRHQLKSISNGALVILGYPVGLLLLWLKELIWFKESSVLLELNFYFLLLGVCTVSFLPAFYLHIVYYLTNRYTVVEVDKQQQLITITDKKGKHVIHASDIKQVARVVQRDYRLPEKQQNWFPVPWRKYGYLKLVTHDNTVFLLTSLMLDPINPLIKETETQYKFLPDIDETFEEELTNAEIEDQLRVLVESFKLKFKDHTEQELVEKISKKGYRKEAVIAAEELLHENILNNKK